MAEVVVITGASAGVGRAVAREFARQGARIGLLSRNRKRLEETRLEVERLGGAAIVIPTDVADADQVERAAETVEREFGPIDIWVNNAMTTVFARFLDITPDEFRRTTEVTYLGFVYGTMSALRRMYRRNRGTIVQVGSALAYRSIPLQSAYCGAKHAIVGFTDSIRSELIAENSNVHLTVVHLPAVNTPQFHWCRTKLPLHPQPVPPIYEPEIVARVIAWAGHHRKREVWVGANTIKAIIGQKVIPGWLDSYLADYQAQQADWPVEPDRPDNLFKTVAGDYRAHGEFCDEATSFSPQAWATTHRGTVAALGGGLLGIAFAAWAKREKAPTEL